MTQNVWKGLLAGAIAGLVGTAVKTLWEEFAPARPEDTTSPPLVLADRVKEQTVGGPVPESSKPIVEQSIHWAFGTGIGALYGAVAELVPQAQKGAGSPLGLALYGATHGSVLPMLNAEPWPLQRPAKFVSSEFSGHILYGLAVEITRRKVRELLDDRDIQDTLSFS
ncbi:DUF1440 domain-containing protein [Rhabdobacter roseus]|uniref:Putative membrane protein YagU involved in acid resistance n=1 Tax=Rhabdobacter roseus TaxID=1655419 RepID=A0A840TMN1_9BACT|nr:DUF1440 domain-containing protein [Rhabdobacter roseus]MBB5282473.1 putative membrane protein YagU involved in acid resistance [Rhabdobacter roseus]